MYDQPLYTKDYTICPKILEFIDYDQIQGIIIFARTTSYHYGAVECLSYLKKHNHSFCLQRNFI